MKSMMIISALAAFATAQLETRSPDFRLVVYTETNDVLNGTVLDACHEGAAIEAFCSGPKLPDAGYGTNFYFNTSIENTNPKAANEPGILSYDLVIANNEIIPSAMNIAIIPTSNVAVPVLYPGPNQATSVQFDENDELYVLSTRDDTANPVVIKDERIKQWYICTTYYAYTYVTLGWVVGKGATPQNPTCEKVSIKRVYI